MRRTKGLRWVTGSVAVILGLWVCGFPTLALAKKFSLPTGRGIPGRRESAGSRQPCLNPETVVDRQGTQSVRLLRTLTALVPQTGYGETVSAYPTFVWHMPPFTKDVSERRVEFTLQEENVRRPIYQAAFEVADTSGWMSLTLPSLTGLPPLSPGKAYIWRVRVTCSSENDSYPVASGVIQRVEASPALMTALQRARPSDIPALYIENGVWYEAIATLIQLRRERPRDASLSTLWQTWMEDPQIQLRQFSSISFK
ncbi:MAG: DUF928 domain-containing protein [Leptolyngbyaceae cyanobacterium bins.59]|nr:DUF928 domain-containing protein [Leptolyngbyaceae cyanobacterium bins.59]